MQRFDRLRHRRNQRGAAIIWFTLALVGLLGLSAWAIDVGYWYYIEAKLHRSADAAALAAAQWMFDGQTEAAATTEAGVYAAANGTTVPANGVTFPKAGIVTVQVTLPLPAIFSGLFGITGKNAFAKASAEYVATQSTFNPQYSMGVTAAYNYSVFGPMGWHQYGDEYDTKYLDNNANALPAGTYVNQINPLYAEGGHNGSYFGVTLPSSMSAYKKATGTSQFTVELYDPSTNGFNTDTNDKTAPGDPLGLDGSYTVNGSTFNWEVPDEWRDSIAAYSTGLQPGYSDESTNGDTTWFTVQYLNSSGQWVTATNASGTPATTVYTSQPWTEGQWIEDPNLTIDTSNSLYQVNGTLTSFRVNVTTTDPSLTDPTATNVQTNGSSENGFNLRVGPPLYNSTVQSTMKSGIGSNPVVATGASPGGNGSDYVVTMGQSYNKGTTASDDNPYLGVTQTINSESSWSSNVNGVDGGTNISAEGHVEVNFNNQSTAVMGIGTVNSTYAGDTLDFARFDTDVGATGVSYIDGGTASTTNLDSTVSGGTTMFSYTLSGTTVTTKNGGSTGTFGGAFGNGNPPSGGNDAAATDTVLIPTNYSANNPWYIEYSASSSDTSDWSVGMTRPGTIGTIFLIGQNGNVY